MLKFIEGFDSYSAVSQIADGRKWTSGDRLSIFGSLVAGRTGGYALRLSHETALLRKSVDPALQSGVVGFALRVNTYGAFSSFVTYYSYDGIFHLKRSDTTQISLNVTSAGLLEVVRNGGTRAQLGISTKNLIKNAWHYVEVKFVISASAGSVIVNVDEEEWINFSGQTANASLDEYYDTIYLSDKTGYSNAQTDFDDFYFADLTGSKNNDFLGDCVVSTLLPDGDTADADFTPDSGTDSYAMVNGTINDETGLESETVGHKTIVTLGSLPAAGIGTIAGVQVCARVKKDDAGGRSVRNVIVSGATEDPQTAYALADQYTNNVDLLEDDPNEAAGTAWTEASVNAMQVGVEITA